MAPPLFEPHRRPCCTIGKFLTQSTYLPEMMLIQLQDRMTIFHCYRCIDIQIRLQKVSQQFQKKRWLVTEHSLTSLTILRVIFHSSERWLVFIFVKTYSKEKTLFQRYEDLDIEIVLNLLISLDKFISELSYFSIYLFTVWSTLRERKCFELT